jgi:hypothetical protein
VKVTGVPMIVPRVAGFFAAMKNGCEYGIAVTEERVSSVCSVAQVVLAQYVKSYRLVEVLKNIARIFPSPARVVCTADAVVIGVVDVGIRCSADHTRVV